MYWIEIVSAGRFVLGRVSIPKKFVNTSLYDYTFERRSCYIVYTRHDPLPSGDDSLAHLKSFRLSQWASTFARLQW